MRGSLEIPVGDDEADQILGLRRAALADEAESLPQAASGFLRGVERVAIIAGGAATLTPTSTDSSTGM